MQTSTTLPAIYNGTKGGSVWEPIDFTYLLRPFTVDGTTHAYSVSLREVTALRRYVVEQNAFILSYVNREIKERIQPQIHGMILVQW
jgi:hypothetical protein